MRFVTSNFREACFDHWPIRKTIDPVILGHETNPVRNLNIFIAIDDSTVFLSITYWDCRVDISSNWFIPFSALRWRERSSQGD